MAGLYSSGLLKSSVRRGTICGGGRYDGLVEHLGGRSTPGVGFALGMERVVLLMESLDVVPDMYQTQANIYLMPQQIRV